jgi:hypothetical protein
VGLGKIYKCINAIQQFPIPWDYNVGPLILLAIVLHVVQLKSYRRYALQAVGIGHEREQK